MRRPQPVRALGLALALAALLVSSPGRADPARPSQLPPLERVRATKQGAVAGVIAGLAVAVLGTLSICQQDTDVGPPCKEAGDYLGRFVILGVVFVPVGAGAGALVGAGVPRWRAWPPQSFHERGADRPIGSLGLALGTASSLGGGNTTSGTAALRFTTRFGPYFAVGPELGYSHFGRTQLVSASGPGPTVTRGARQLGITTLLSIPSGEVLEARLVLGVGLISHRWDSRVYDHHLGGSAGLGGEWRFARTLATFVEGRLWTVLDRHRGSGGGHSFATLSAGLAAHW